MDHTAKIFKMKSLGFTLDQIAATLGLNQEQLKEIFQKNNYPSKEKKKLKSKGLKNRNDRPPLRRDQKTQVQVLPVPEKSKPILEVKPGFYVLTADDLLAFASRLKERLIGPLDPFEDYVQKDVFQKQFGISDTTLQRHQKDGILIVFKLGNKQYLKKSQVVEALEKGKL